MIEQAGVYKITLYENKDVVLNYIDSENIDNITTSGQTIEIENSDDETINLKLEFDVSQSDNNKTFYKHLLTLIKFGYDNETLEYFNDICDSIYGWIPKIEFYNGDIKVYTNPFKSNNSDGDTNISMSIGVNLENVTFGQKPLDFQ